MLSTFDKAKKRILSKPKDYTYSEAKSLLEHMGFKEFTKGKTTGSRVKFYRQDDEKMIMLHKPHPEDTMKPGAVRFLLEYLVKIGELE